MKKVLYTPEELRAKAISSFSSLIESSITAGNDCCVFSSPHDEMRKLEFHISEGPHEALPSLLLSCLTISERIIKLYGIDGKAAAVLLASFTDALSKRRPTSAPKDSIVQWIQPVMEEDDEIPSLQLAMSFPDDGKENLATVLLSADEAFGYYEELFHSWIYSQVRGNPLKAGNGKEEKE